MRVLKIASYEKILETKVIRTQHLVRIFIGETASSIMNTLKNVPPKARLIEVDEDDRSNEKNYAELYFEEEKIINEKVE